MLNEVTLSTSTFMRMMRFIPNLEFLTLINVRTVERESVKDLTLILRKLKNIKIEHCSNEYENIMNTIRESRVREATLVLSGSQETTIPNVSTFLRTNQKTLKKLIISFEHKFHAQNIIWDFKEMQLQHFDLAIDEKSNNIMEFFNRGMHVGASFVDFLRKQKQMEYLKCGNLKMNDQAMEAISSGMKKLETLALYDCLGELSVIGLSNLSKMDNLKNLLLGEDAGLNVFESFIGKVKENLQHLRVDFDYYYGNEFIAELSNSMPNLKKLEIAAIENPEHVGIALENFENLEDVLISSIHWDIQINKELPKLKKLTLDRRLELDDIMTKIQLKRKFCRSLCNSVKNLEYLRLGKVNLEQLTLL